MEAYLRERVQYDPARDLGSVAHAVRAVAGERANVSRALRAAGEAAAGGGLRGTDRVPLRALTELAGRVRGREAERRRAVLAGDLLSADDVLGVPPFGASSQRRLEARFESVRGPLGLAAMGWEAMPPRECFAALLRLWFSEASGPELGALRRARSGSGRPVVLALRVGTNGCRVETLRPSQVAGAVATCLARVLRSLVPPDSDLGKLAAALAEPLGPALGRSRRAREAFASACRAVRGVLGERR